jgi:predicted nucleic acid-binding protein
MPRPLAVDASFTFRLVLPGPQQTGYHSLMSEWLAEGYRLIAPSLWAYEMTSALCKVVRFGELTPEEGGRALALAQALGVELVLPDEELVRAAFEWTMRLDRAAAYDSFYLALAERLQCTLWTADRHLRNVVNQPWVRLVGATT